MQQQEERLEDLHTVNVEMVEIFPPRTSSLKRVREDEKEVKEGKIKKKKKDSYKTQA